MPDPQPQIQEIDSAATAIDTAMIADRHPLRRGLEQVRGRVRRGQPADRKFAAWEEKLERSRARASRRRDRRPDVTIDSGLPIAAHADDIAAALRDHQIVIVSGETGSGKSTQLPKICLQAGRGIFGWIGHTQPRRLAARSIAQRIAEELGGPVGRDVGFKMRFIDETPPEAYIKVMTDGILLAETAGDRFLERYDTLIIDEAHERSLNIDFLLGMLRQMLPRRPELRCIVTSATLDTERFVEHFTLDGRAPPVLAVEGRAYPVEVRYRPLEVEEDEQDPDLLRGIRQSLEEIAGSTDGDVLVFLPTERDIREAAQTLRGWARKRQETWEVMPLYARLPSGEQQRIFAPHRGRRVVLATNVAESSLTVPGIRAVIDTGTARISRYAPRSKVQRLPIEPVAQASADQRKGRCGRVGPGICVRLYSEDDYLARDRYATPEIRRTQLASVILRTKMLKLGPVEEFPFPDPPRPEAVREGYRTLFEIGALDERRELTDLGRELSRLPVDPRIGRMLLAADDEGCLAEVAIIAAALEIQDPRDRPVEKREAADEKHARFRHPSSDFLAYLSLWDFYQKLKASVSRNRFKIACRDNFLSHMRLREWSEIHRQLLHVLAESGRRPGPRRDDPDAVHRALLAGLLSGIAQRSDKFEYTGGGGIKFHLWPGSGLFESPPAWIVVAELVETTRRYGRTAGQLQPRWVESLAEHLLKRTYSEPHWSRRRGAARVYERVNLFGLAIVTRRPVDLGPINPSAARELLIQHGLIEEELIDDFAFLRSNHEVLCDVQRLAAQVRRADWIVDEETIRDFYDQNLAAEAYDRNRLRRWLRKHPQAEESLRLRREDLLPRDEPLPESEEFPTSVRVQANELPVSYRFEPGSEEDGATLVVPEPALTQLPPEIVDWGVPGWLQERVTALIRSLPKSIRRNLVPAPDTAEKAVQRIEFGRGPFLPAVARALQEVSGEHVPADAFQWDRVPPHLRLHVRVVDEEGNVVARDQDLQQLRREVGVTAGDTVALPESSFDERDGMKDWDVGDLPEQVEVPSGGVRIAAFPALVDGGSDVGLKVFANPQIARQHHRAGVRRLYVLAQRNQIKAQVAWLPGWEQMRLQATGMPAAPNLESHIGDLMADRAFLSEEQVPRTAESFQQRTVDAEQRIAMAVQEVAPLLGRLLASYQEARLAVEGVTQERWQYAVEDVRRQLDDMLPEDFLVRTPWPWLEHLPRYLQAVAYRLERLTAGSEARDRQALDELAPHLEAWRSRDAAHRETGICDPALTEFRWMLEEFRVSLFAQPLGTAHSVSSRRLEKLWQKVV